MALRDEVAIGEECRAHCERLELDVPQPEVAGLVDVPHPFQRRQEPVRGRRRQLHATGDVCQRQAATALGQRFENGEAAIRALHLACGRTGLAWRAATARWSGIAM